MPFLRELLQFSATHTDARSFQVYTNLTFTRRAAAAGDCVSVSGDARSGYGASGHPARRSRISIGTSTLFTSVTE